MKICTYCKLEKPYSEFYKGRDYDGRQYWCIACMKLQRQERIKKQKEEDPIAYRRKVFNNELFRLYGITIETYEQLLKEQDGVCAICKNVPNGRLCVDHDHEIGWIRGLLCHNCNIVLGLMKDDPKLLRRAAEYLEE